MPPALTTSSPVQALIRGLLASVCMLSMLWLLDLPLDWKLGSILMAVTGLSFTIAFYDGSRPKPTRTAQVLMSNVQWNFANSVGPGADDFVRAFSEWQDDDSAWNPDQPFPDHGPIEVHLTLYHRDDDSDIVLVLEPPTDGQWTQATLLQELHHNIDLDLLANYTFFEGLVRFGDGQYSLSLGS